MSAISLPMQQLSIEYLLLMVTCTFLVTNDGVKMCWLICGQHARRLLLKLILSVLFALLMMMADEMMMIAEMMALQLPAQFAVCTYYAD
ncbi:hypothetical protein U9M48_015929, partial [Paspalum notatum var. saurae]